MAVQTISGTITNCFGEAAAGLELVITPALRIKSTEGGAVVGVPRSIRIASDGSASIDLETGAYTLSLIVGRTSSSAPMNVGSDGPYDWADVIDAIEAVNVASAAANAVQAAIDAQASAVEAALYDGPKVDTFAGLASIAPAALAVGGLIRVIETGAVYERVTSGGDLDYTGSGGVLLKLVSRGVSFRAFGEASDIADPAPARVKGPLSDVINLYDFMDDAAAVPGISALQAALDVGGRVHRNVRIPAGVAVVLVDAWGVIPSNSGIVGDGHSSILTCENTLGGMARMLQDDWTTQSENITLRDFCIDRSGAYSEHAALFNGVDGLLFENLKVTGTPSVWSGAIAVSGIVAGGFVGPRLKSTNVRAINNILEDVENFGFQYGYVHHGAMVANICRRAYREVLGVEPESGDSAYDILIADNIIDANYTGLGTETGAIVVTMTSGASSIGAVRLRGNLVTFNTDLTATGSKNPGIGLYGTMDCISQGDTVIGAAGPGIQLGNLAPTGIASGIIVDGATILDCNQSGHSDYYGSGIYCRGGNNNVVTRTRVRGSAHVTSYAEDNSAASNRILDNAFHDTTPTSPLAFTTTYTTQRDGTYSSGHDAASAPVMALRGSATQNPRIGFHRGGYESFRLQSANTDGDIYFTLYGDAGATLSSPLALLRGAAGARQAKVQFSSGAQLGFYGATPAGKIAVTGSRATPEQALKNLLTALATYGLITDSTSA